VLSTALSFVETAEFALYVAVVDTHRVLRARETTEPLNIAATLHGAREKLVYICR
jgi:hypothetical protein